MTSILYAPRPARKAARALVLLLALTACTPEQKSLVTSVGGGIGGALIGSQFGKGNGRLIGAVIGAAVGTFAGYQLAKYLNEEEQKSYSENLNNQMKAIPADKGGEVNWQNTDKSKTAATNVSYSSGIDKFRDANKYDQEIVKTLPANTTCRTADTTLKTGTSDVSYSGVYCRNADGDYVRIDQQNA
jgi:surface antigen